MDKPSIVRPYAEWVISHRLSVTLTSFGVTALLGWRIGKLRMATSANSWAAQKRAAVATTNLLEEVFGGRNLTVSGIAPKQGDIYQPEVLAKIKRIRNDIE